MEGFLSNGESRLPQRIVNHAIRIPRPVQLARGKHQEPILMVGREKPYGHFYLQLSVIENFENFRSPLDIDIYQCSLNHAITPCLRLQTASTRSLADLRAMPAIAALLRP